MHFSLSRWGKIIFSLCATWSWQRNSWRGFMTDDSSWCRAAGPGKQFCSRGPFLLRKTDNLQFSHPSWIEYLFTVLSGIDWRSLEWPLTGSLRLHLMFSSLTEDSSWWHQLCAWFRFSGFCCGCFLHSLNSAPLKHKATVCFCQWSLHTWADLYSFHWCSAAAWWMMMRAQWHLSSPVCHHHTYSTW